MQLYFTNNQKVWKFGIGSGSADADVSGLFERYGLPAGTPVLLTESMQPVEPLSGWFRDLALDRRSGKTMRAYAYSALMLLQFLRARGVDLVSAAEPDIQDFRRWRQDEAEETVGDATWDRDAAAIDSLFRYLKSQGLVERRPWRMVRGRKSLASGTRRDLRVRHMELEQYLFCRDVGFGGLTPQADLDETFRGWRPHRNRAVCEMALLTGMRLQEWSTLLLPELGLIGGARPRSTSVDLARCAKGGHHRSVDVPADAMELLDPYLLIERPEIVARAQGTLWRRRRDLFVIARLEADGSKVRGVLDGRVVTRTIKDMDPQLRRIAVMETGEGLDPLALFVGAGGRMLTASGWDRVRWTAWERMKRYAGGTAVLPRRCWVYHDLRHTFALRLLIHLTREVLNDARDLALPMSTLLEHMTGNPLLRVQQRLGHATPATTYRYVRYLKEPMKDVDEAFREWTAAGGASYAQIAAHMMGTGGRGIAAQG